KRLAETNVAAVEIRVEPGDAGAQLAVSSFAPDETFAPRTIHLPPGRHVILVKAPGYRDTQHTVEVADKAPQHVVIALGRPPAQLGRPWLYAGGALALVGAGTYAWMSVEWVREDRAKTHRDYSAPHASFERAKWATIGLWSLAAACFAVHFW